VLLGLGAVAFGAIWRDRVETGGSDRLLLSNLVASNSNDVDVPESRFFDDIMALLHKKYVDPIDDDMKLSDGAVRGMVASLGDPNSLYMDADQYRVYANARDGKFEGIGADLVLTRDNPKGPVVTGGDSDSEDASATLPKLMVAAVVPGSSADKAGLKPGDWAEFVDDHWIPNDEALERFQDMEKELVQARNLTRKDPSAAPKFQALASEYLKARRLLQDEAEKHVYPIKARDRLMIGTAGVVRTQWEHDGHPLILVLNKGKWDLPGFGVEPDGAIRLPFIAESPDRLKEALAGKSEATIDLRNNVDGDYDTMVDCLNAVAPSGDYGYIDTHRNEKPTVLKVAEGTKEHLRLTLIVGRTTRGAAEIFAQALASRGIAKIVGGPTAGDPHVVRWFKLPDGAGYTLVTGTYSSTTPGVLARRDSSKSSPLGDALATGGKR